MSPTSRKQCRPGESYNEQLKECQVPQFVVDGKTIPVPNGTFEHICVKIQTYSHDSYALIKNGLYYYIDSTGQSFHRQRVYF